MAATELFMHTATHAEIPKAEEFTIRRQKRGNQKGERARMSTPESPADKHTPCPWHATDEGFIEDESGNTIAQIFDNTDSGLDPIDHEQSDYNSLLICAAPDLLAALQEIVSMNETRGRGKPVVRVTNRMTDIARAAIARATSDR